MIVEFPRKKGQTWLSWLVIIVLVIGITKLQMIRPQGEEGTGEDPLSLLLVQMQGRVIAGAADWTRKANAQGQAQGLGNFSATPDSTKKSLDGLYDQAKALNTGPVEHRLRFLVLAGELKGAGEALDQLGQLERRLAKDGVEPDATQKDLLTVLAHLYGDYQENHFDAPSLSEGDRELIKAHLGWFGELALAPAGSPDMVIREAVMAPAYRALIAVAVATVVFLVLGLAGFVGFFVLMVLLFSGKLGGAFGERLPYGGVYAETFALWMLLFLGLDLAVTMAPVERWKWLLLGGAQLLSLAALAWPVLRGVPWRQVRQDIGLTTGRTPALEPVIGVGCYATAIPLLAVGLLVSLTLMSLQRGQMPGVDPQDNFEVPNQPTHPIIEVLARSGWWGRLQVLLLASVIAPVVEETMFRGVLYRHVRELSARFGTVLSVLLSATVVSFIFAVIHPQGLVFVPALMALAYAFALAREWRGTLIPGMLAHGINNSLILLFCMAIMGG